jgi:hypothetical protein
MISFSGTSGGVNYKDFYKRSNRYCQTTDINRRAKNLKTKKGDFSFPVRV